MKNKLIKLLLALLLVCLSAFSFIGCDLLGGNGDGDGNQNQNQGGGDQNGGQDGDQEELPCEHQFEDKVCKLCGAPQPSVGLEYQLNADGQGYTLMGVGSCEDTDVVVAEEYEGKPVTAIDERAFFKSQTITSIWTGDSVSKIGDYAFYNCVALTKAVLGKNLTSISSYAFENCTALRELDIFGKVTSAGFYTFRDCSSLVNVKFSGTVKDWAQIYFGNYQANPVSLSQNFYVNGQVLTTADLTGSTKVSSFAFYNCQSLTQIILPETVTLIGEQAFYNCNGVTSVEIPNSLTKIETGAFQGCSTLATVTLGENVQSIGANAFGDCELLTFNTVETGLYLPTSQNPYYA